MTTVVLDQPTIDCLSVLESGTELRDAGGRPFAFLLAPDEYRKLLYAWAKTLDTDEEIEQLRQEPDAGTLSEILAELEAQ